jgi:phosphomannomutase
VDSDCAIITALLRSLAVVDTAADLYYMITAYHNRAETNGQRLSLVLTEK